VTRFGCTPTDAAPLYDAAGEIIGIRIIHPDDEPCWGVPYGEQCRCGIINTDPATGPVFVPVDELDEPALIASAANRRTAILTDGRQARLIRYGGWRRHRWQRDVRVEWLNGRRVTLPIQALDSVVYPAGPAYVAPIRRRS
jgi:hypothetical protein